ncbi:tripartite tricarboxylate transporter TctB family protein, partial [Arthrobacter deserti]|nr:tripartite tricarboxylate transporter TctB family protein [Arthrobacter deserti]
MNETANVTPAPAEPEEDLTPEQLAARWEAEAPPAAGPGANLASSVLASALGAAGVILSLQLGLGTPAEPRPGLWPFAMGLVIVVLGLAQLVIGRRGGEGEKFSRLSWLVLFGAATLAGFVALMPVIGFEIPSVLLCFIWMKYLGG